MSEILQIKPYARLITMLGDQLIKDESVALSELIKNSYDADATEVSVGFFGFSDDFKPGDNAKIVVSDNGTGMTERIIKESWLNPATPEKFNLIKSGKDTTYKGRIIQGEKGIGRFSIFKLGKTVELITSPEKMVDGIPVDKDGGIRFYVEYDFSMFDDSFSGDDGNNLFLNELPVSFSSSSDVSPIFPENKSYGTQLILTHLRGSWGVDKIHKVQLAISRMQPIFDKDLSSSPDSDANDLRQNRFNVVFYNEKGKILLPNDPVEKLPALLHSDKPAIKITLGHFNPETFTYTFDENGFPRAVQITSGSELSKFPEARRLLDNRPISCGPFDFEFYIFDPAASLEDEPRHRLEKDEYDIIKSHRIYLYRDGVRVMPYGDPDNDWIGIDTLRGTEKASAFMSNDQTVGCIKISRQKNPDLEDKTSREGLIENGRSTTDFIDAIRLFLRWVRAYPYTTYQQTKERKQEENRLAAQTTLSVIKEAKEKFQNNPELAPILDKIAASYASDRSEYDRRLEITDRLAGIGMSVETTSHDVNLFLNRASDGLDALIKELTAKNDYSKDDLFEKLISIRGDLSLAQKQMDNIGILYPGTRAKPKKNNVWSVISKIKEIYQYQLNKYGISCAINMPESPLVVDCVPAVLLQSFMNLLDNSIYWLSTSALEEKKVIVTIDSDTKKVYFADNGPGIPEADYGFIFKPFFSRKGEDGKGLGLYIADQLLGRYGFSIGLITEANEKMLPGANFVIDFNDSRKQ